MQDENEELAWGESPRGCDTCGEHITYTEEVFLLQVCAARISPEGRLEWAPILFEEDQAFEAYLLHFSCWEDALDDIQEATNDVPPRDAENPVMICTVCKSLIGTGEAFVAATFAELHVSRRSPSGQHTDSIAPMAAPDPICFECVAHVIDEYFPAWEEVIHYMPEGYLEIPC